MFLTFPDGWPGAGLLLLRATAGIVMIIQADIYFAGKHDLSALVLIAAMVGVAIGSLLLIGCLTRFAAVVAGLAILSSAFFHAFGSHIQLGETPMTPILVIVIVAAVICLGPGAFSVDARLFGRREVIIPRSRTRENSA